MDGSEISKSLPLHVYSWPLGAMPTADCDHEARQELLTDYSRSCGLASWQRTLLFNFLKGSTYEMLDIPMPL